MPPPLPDRFRLEVRTGRDGDIEEWLGTDTSLDRPVLVRFLGPDSSPERRREFLEAVRGAASVNHAHLASVFTAGEIPDGVFAVSDWSGGMTLADRLKSGETIEVDEFLPNAAGLASALAGLHAEGAVHGAIDTTAIFYAVAHPAKLGAFGRHRRDHTASDDVRALARVLDEGLTGNRPGGPPPSEVVDGLSPAVDHALRSAQAGRISARALAEELLAAPSPVHPHSEPPGWSRRLLVLAGVLVVSAVALVGIGRLLLADAGTPSLFPPVTEAPSTVVIPASTTITAADTPDTSISLTVTESSVVDPYGGGDENDQRLPNVLDSDPNTVWRTERYRDPLPLLKPGVGVAFTVSEDPRLLQLSGFTDGVGYLIAWTNAAAPNPETWEEVVHARSAGGTAIHQLPERSGGWWVVWLRDLPLVADGDHSAEIAEVRFRS